MFTFGWFSSGRDQAAIDLFTTALDRMESGFIPGRLAFVFCDREPGEAPASDKFLETVRGRGLPLVTHSSKRLRQMIKARPPELEAFRASYDSEVIARLKDFGVEVMVMAGYMLILSEVMCRAFLCLNLHPAVPGGPAGTWQEVMWRLMADGAREAGATMHLATPELDAGPPVTCFRFSLRGPAFDPLWADFQGKLQTRGLKAIKAQEGEAEPLFAKIRAEELRREFPLILLTLKYLAEGRLRLTRQGAETAGRLLTGGFDLTDRVEEFLR